MGTVEHLKTLCCLGLAPESAMVAVVPLLHEIIPHGATRIWLFGPDATIGNGFSEHPDTVPLCRERFWRFMDDPQSPLALWNPLYRAVGIGWTLHRQGYGWLDSGYYREIEAPLDSCWILDAMIGEGGRTYAGLVLTRPRCARPFGTDDVQSLDRLRPWLAHALAPQRLHPAEEDVGEMAYTTAAVVRSGQILLAPPASIVYQTPGLDFLLRLVDGRPGNYTLPPPSKEALPPAIRMLVQSVVGAARGRPGVPPRMRIQTAYGLLVLEATWLMPSGTNAQDVSRDPTDCLVSVTIELRETAIAHAARVLRESGATPAQVKVGVQLASGKTKPVIARALGIQPSSVADQTKKLYQQLGVHNTAELGLKLWLGRASPQGTLGRS